MVGEWKLEDLEIRYRAQKRYCKLLSKDNKYTYITDVCQYVLQEFINILDVLKYNKVSKETIDLAERYLDLIQEHFNLQIDYAKDYNKLEIASDEGLVDKISVIEDKLYIMETLSLNINDEITKTYTKFINSLAE